MTAGFPSPPASHPSNPLRRRMRRESRRPPGPLVTSASDSSRPKCGLLSDFRNLSTGSHLGEGVRVPDTPEVSAELGGRFEGGVQEGVIHERRSLVGAAQSGGDEYLLE